VGSETSWLSKTDVLCIRGDSNADTVIIHNPKEKYAL
jgi:hypothetical protein